MKSITSIHYAIQILICYALAAPCVGLSQGVVLRPGDLFEAAFSSMMPGTHELQVTDRAIWEFNGTLTVSRTDLPFSFHVDLINGTDASPFWSYLFKAPVGSWTKGTDTFGAAIPGSSWTSMSGVIRVRYISGPPVTLTELRAYQSFSIDGTYRSYEAIMPVPEPSFFWGGCIAVLFYCWRASRRVWPNPAVHANPDSTSRSVTSFR